MIVEGGQAFFSDSSMPQFLQHSLYGFKDRKVHVGNDQENAQTLQKPRREKNYLTIR